MKIESIRIKNFKMFKDVEIKNIPNFVVVVGANGTGKTTLFNVFGFLKDCFIHNVSLALRNRGGFGEVISRGATKEETITIEIKFRMEILKVNRLVTYLLEIGKEGGKPIVQREKLSYKRGSRGLPYHFLDFAKGVVPKSICQFIVFICF